MRPSNLRSRRLHRAITRHFPVIAVIAALAAMASVSASAQRIGNMSTMGGMTRGMAVTPRVNMGGISSMRLNDSGLRSDRFRDVKGSKISGKNTGNKNNGKRGSTDVATNPSSDGKPPRGPRGPRDPGGDGDRKSTRLNSSHT